MTLGVDDVGGAGAKAAVLVVRGGVAGDVPDFVLVHTFLAGFFMYLMLLSMGTRRVSAFSGAMLFALNGYVIARLQFLSILGSAVWLPLVMMLVMSLLKKGRGGTGIVLSVAAGLALSVQFLAGHTQILGYSLFAIVLFAGAEAVFGKKTGR